jgi:hypothetical protein
MATPIWQSGTLYNPGALVQPSTSPPVVTDQPTNGNFEGGNTGWTLGSGFSIGEFGQAFQGTWSLQYNQNGSPQRATNANLVPVNVGQVINFSARVQQGASSSGQAGALAAIDWLDASGVLVSTTQGNLVSSGSNAEWKVSSGSGVCPPGATQARMACDAYRNSGSAPLWVDDFTWDYAYSGPPDGLIFRAVQADAGFSGNNEPTWPTVLGNTVVDNEVTWEAVLASRVTWEATPILLSGTVEPTWPTVVQSTVADNTIAWEAVSRRVEDEKCPNTKVVVIAVSKIFAADNDIIKYSATVNPLDWSTEEDAGYLPFGLQTYGANPVTAMGLYRSNLVAFNGAGFQMWQIDQDPVNMALLDAVPVGSLYHKALSPVSNDLSLLTNQGIRTVGIAGASTNLKAGDFGKQLDPLVRAKIKEAVYEGRALYWPAQGQYWLFFGDEAFVLTMNGGAKDKSFSRYVFPEAITDWTLVGDDLYLRTEEDKVWKVDDDALMDDMVGNYGEEFVGVIHWPALDLGNIGADKSLEALDIICTGEVGIQIGYDQRDFSVLTPMFTTDGDTLTGFPLPFPVTAPSLSLRLTFSANQAWEWEAATMYVNDL